MIVNDGAWDTLQSCNVLFKTCEKVIPKGIYTYLAGLVIELLK